MNTNCFNLKILTCFIIFTIFLNLSCIFAYENNDSFMEYEAKVESETNTLKNIKNENFMSTQHSLDGGSFRDIQNLVDVAESGDTIILNGKFVAENNSSLISIDKKLNIISSSGAILDGNEISGIFHLKTGSDSSFISGLTFINGKYDTGSAVMAYSKNLIFENCIFENNTGTENGGGAFATKYDPYISEGLTIKNSVFKGNSAPASSGAAACFSTNFKIINTLFENNYASNNIGRTAYEGALQAGMTGTYGLISNCTFKNNYAKSNNKSQGSWAGALSIRKGTTVEKSTFINNYADYGGAIHVSGDGEIKDCTFTKNTAINGGAVYNANNLNVINSHFNYNYASNYGGAIYNEGNLNSKNSHYNNNKAKSTLSVKCPSYVNCSNNAKIKVIFEGGNNINNNIWSKNKVTIDNKQITPNNKIPSQKITLSIGGKTFTAITDKNGVATFKFNTKNFKVKKHSANAEFKESNNYFGSSENFNLKITKKIEYKIKLKNKKKIKKVPVYKAYIPSVKYINTKYRIEYYYKRFANVDVLYFMDSNKGVKKVRNYIYNWKKVNEKDVNSKYKWYKSKYCNIYKYKTTKITSKYLNGKLVKNSVKKNHVFTEKTNYKNKRTADFSKFVLPSVDCESDNKKIIELSKNIIKKEAKKLKKSVSKLTDQQKANAILNWVQLNKKYELYGNTRYGAVKSLSKKINCADSTHLTVALLRAANIPAKYNAKSVAGQGGHCWPLAYLNGKWIPGEATEQQIPINFGKHKDLYAYWIIPKAEKGSLIDSYKYSKKFVQHGKDKLWMNIVENHYVNGKWQSYYVLNGNANLIKNK